MHAGRCLCGKVSFTVEAEPLAVRACWCRLCQYLGAGSATVNAIFPAEALSVTGETADYQSVADSGAAMHRRFCASCGTALFSASETRPHLIVIRVGALDDPERYAPQSTIWTSAAPAWACISDDIPRVEKQPPPAG